MPIIKEMLNYKIKTSSLGLQTAQDVLQF